MRLRRIGLVLLVMGVGVTTSRAQDKPPPTPSLERLELDRRIVKIVYDSASLGTEIFNKGNFEGCFRLYQGTLLAIQPLLDHRAKLAQSVKDKLDRAKSMSAVDGAFALRAALDDIQNDIAPNIKTEPKDTKSDTKLETKAKTLWERLGSLGGVQRIVNTSFLNAIENPKLKPKLTRPGKKLDAKDFELSIIEYISSVTGGPLPYKGKNMKAAHAGLNITDDEFTAMATIIEGALKSNKVEPADIKEFMALVEATRKDIVEVKSKN